MTDEKKKEYFKRYYQEHKEKIKKHTREYYLSHKEQLAERTKELRHLYYEKNKEKLDAYSKQYDRDHVESRKIRSKRYRDSHKDLVKALTLKWAKSHKEHLKKYRLEWKKKHKNNANPPPPKDLLPYNHITPSDTIIIELVKGWASLSINNELSSEGMKALRDAFIYLIQKGYAKGNASVIKLTGEIHGKQMV